jgi:hypothetical protein
MLNPPRSGRESHFHAAVLQRAEIKIGADEQRPFTHSGQSVARWGILGEAAAVVRDDEYDITVLLAERDDEPRCFGMT